MAYRREEHPVRYVCVVCWQTVTSTQGVCERDGAPLQAIESDDLTIITELRRRAREKKERPGRRLAVAVFLTSLLSSLIVHGLLIGYGVYDIKLGRGHTDDGGARLAGWAVILTAILFAVPFTFVLRRFDGFKPLPGADRFDPDAAIPDALADWLGLTVDEKQK